MERSQRSSSSPPEEFASRCSVLGKIYKRRHLEEALSTREASVILIVIAAVLKQVKVALATLLNMTENELFTEIQRYLFLQLSVTPR